MIQTTEANKRYSAFSIPKLLSLTNSHPMEQILTLPDQGYDLNFFISFRSIETVMSLKCNRQKRQKQPTKCLSCSETICYQAFQETPHQ